MKQNDGTESRLEKAAEPAGTRWDAAEHESDEWDLQRSMRELTDLRRALDESSIVAITDHQGVITYVNDKFCERSQYSREELLGSDHSNVNSQYHPKEYIRGLWKTIGAGKIWRGDLRNRAKDGTIYWVSTTIVPFLDDDGVPYQYLAIRNDITERKQTEQELERLVRRLAELTDRERGRAEELRRAHDQLVDANRRLVEEQSKVVQAEKLSSIGMLAAGVAHEINNPLTGIMGCLKAFETGALSEERRTQYVAAMRDGLERIRATIQGLLDYARQGEPNFDATDLQRVASSAVRLLQVVASEKRVEVEQSIPQGQLVVRGDAAQLMQAVVNVVMNAIHVAPPQSAVTISAQREGSHIALRIADDGPGIPAELVTRVCDPFFTTKPEGEGTGLGLSVTLAIVKSHGGDVRFDTERGKGTTVVLTLPAFDGDIENA